MNESVAVDMIDLRRLLIRALGCLRADSPELAQHYISKSIKELDIILQAEIVPVPKENFA